MKASLLLEDHLACDIQGTDRRHIATAMSPSTPMVQLDGTTLEGGGQLLRLALSISSLTRIPIHVTDIRGKRGPISSSSTGGGLKSSHLAGAEWLARATAATTEGMEVKSRELVFAPGRANPGVPSGNSSKEQSTGDVNKEYSGVWKDVHEDGNLTRRTSHIPVSTPGSIALVLQAILPYLLFGPLSPSGETTPVSPLRITISGGTNVSSSPSIDYVSQVLLPVLCLKLGVRPITTTVHKRGWSTGGNMIGKVTFDFEPFAPPSVSPAFSFENRGDLTRMHVSILAPDAKARGIIRDNVITHLLAFNPDIELLFPVDEGSGSDKRWYLLLVAETSNGYRLGRDWLYDLKTKGMRVEETCKNLVSKVLKDLKRELKHGGCVDEYMQDQLVVFQALAAGKATVDAGKQAASLHTQTARWVVKKMLAVGFDEGGSCDGVRLRVGENFLNRDEKVEDVVKSIGGMGV